ncbi:MAG: efflux RND transporter periplasmic adaptor subunit [Dysgonamonadaceae bacterium]|jgi:cobalt-zinc-cadmium efflux system membrane fusion protein|nr:efflux RND transporter periplasmic adaptor subunit [Dysgonamonadaceae bacterium]
MNKYIFTCLWCAVTLVACNQNKSATESADIQYKNDTIIVSENSPVLKDLVAESAQLHDFSAEFRTVGTVRPVSGKLAGIAAPFAGRITKSFVQLGQKVNVGSPVFEFGSSEFYEATKAYFAAQSANELAKINYNRQSELAANGVAAQKDLEQAKNEALIATQEFEQAKATLQLFNIDVESLKMGQPVKITSPIAGEVIKSNITVGNYTKEDSEPAVVVADLSRVWITALVKERYFGSIKSGDRVEIFTNAQPEHVIWGSIHYVGEMLNEETRSLEVIVECNNADRELKLGMFCEVHFLSSPSKALILPSSAILQEQDNDYILIELSRGRYVRRKVETETAGHDSSRIISGVSEGEKVVVKGGIYLNM